MAGGSQVQSPLGHTLAELPISTERSYSTKHDALKCPHKYITFKIKSTLLLEDPEPLSSPWSTSDLNKWERQGSCLPPRAGSGIVSELPSVYIEAAAGLSHLQVHCELHGENVWQTDPVHVSSPPLHTKAALPRTSAFLFWSCANFYHWVAGNVDMIKTLQRRVLCLYRKTE